MSTRSLIGRQEADGTIEFIYCHYDGYPEGVGRTLLDHWSDSDRLDELLALGDLSMLAEEIGEKHPFDLYALPKAEKERYRGQCLAYGRDRGDEDCETRKAADKDDFLAMRMGAEYRYLRGLDGIWRVIDRRGVESELAALFRDETAENPSPP